MTIQRIAAALAATLTLAACTQPTPMPPTPSSTVPVVEDRTYRWIPNPAVDLMSPEGTIIRAATESYDIAIQSDKQGRPAYQDGYPGFAQAFRSPRIGGPYDSGGGDPGRQTLRGTTYYEVIGLTHVGNTYTANLCEYISAIGARSGTGYKSSGGNNFGNSQQVVFGLDPAVPLEQQRPPLANQKGPARRPTDNVFGTWTVTEVGALGGRFPECNKPAPGTPADRPDPYFWPEPPPVLPPDPGWPDAGAA